MDRSVTKTAPDHRPAAWRCPLRERANDPLRERANDLDRNTCYHLWIPLTDLAISWEKPRGFSPEMNPILNGAARSAAAFALIRAFLVLDVLLDDRQGCAAAGGGEVGRGPEVPVHDGAVDPSGELLAEQA